LGVPPELARDDRHRSGVVCVGDMDRAGALLRPARRFMAEALPEALAKAYRPIHSSMPNVRGSAHRRERAEALAGYRPQIVASLSAGLQAGAQFAADNTIQTANLKRGSSASP